MYFYFSEPDFFNVSQNGKYFSVSQKGDQYVTIIEQETFQPAIKIKLPTKLNSIYFNDEMTIMIVENE